VKKMKKIVLAAIAVVMLSASAGAQQMPPGKWWRSDAVAARLGLTADQRKRLEGAFRGAAETLIDTRAEIEKLQLALRSEIDQPQLNRANVLRIAGELSDARGRLFEREVMMLADMRGVLTEQQWRLLRTELESRRPKGRR
jgi:hypothetical protein